MAHWNEVINISDAWNSEEAYSVKRDRIVSQLHDSNWVQESREVQALVDDLANCRIITDFDAVFMLIYAYADRDLVWLETWR